ncbi:plasmid transfer protein TraA [Streptomyces mirabilis]|uniref:plasmid transfer protein TraA n=1 Tax=Streptomyces mirabilis TaxID=68239 RepID=UPI002254B0DB|nr:plasmid transfer protein TraA [Streptomyces mirabilis]MCX4429457.1 plasmid transfer protein TraA [Streptomyces mirabilis]
MSTPTSAHKGAGTKNDSAKFGASFAPSITLNLSQNKTTNNGGGGRRGGSVPAQGGHGGNSQGLLPPPEFTSPADVRNYCNHLRAVMVSVSFEVSMGAEILKAVLSTVPDPQGRIGGSKARAWRVSRKLTKAADSAAAAAKNAAATYAHFQQQYEEEINRVRHRARPPQGPRMNWTQQ